ncbi:precorrin-6y C5,15-methyltransferase (decarboxylating) subunit CbiE [Telmatospirillum sp.]|uniref:precorrin-6y C5,15-methyltransferase (decarboxylating) subunit CbiE n=1 Tax=Telmatospirillum sp. TaxID=2079197 RepID=UPI002852301C|nr:precorrin-6y C5,15-methyltransferase (decarboxylating) subunit CbiE [Telmatospirillum sp.]MDR3437564.1 precorrin-6y C5,15-methyltransferase (decarboxylating) subunit CbiE [Telmatospirillum sp.]
MTAPWLSVVGLGEDGLAGLSPIARQIIADAEILAGGARHLALVPPGPAERLEWATPFAANLERLAAVAGRRVCVLASGDPMWFGVGATLARRFGIEALRIIPHPGSFSLAAARLGWPLHETRCLSIHGRAFETVLLHLTPGARLLLLAEDGTSAARLAGLLVAHGLGEAGIDVFERLGGPAERRLSARADAWKIPRTDDLNTIAVALPDRPRSHRPPSVVPGLPDDAFIHDGQLTKREIRAVTLAALAPWPGAVLWDIGAGCGSVAIEWCRAGGIARAVECDNSRCRMIAANALALGVPDLGLCCGKAPEALASLDGAPDAVFLGGGLSAPGVIETAWAALRPGGRLVANAVTSEAEALLLAWQPRIGGTLTRLSVSRLEPVGRFHTWHPAMPVTQFVAEKS